jgi:hypothetical protein
MTENTVHPVQAVGRPIFIGDVRPFEKDLVGAIQRFRKC